MEIAPDEISSRDQELYRHLCKEAMNFLKDEIKATKGKLEKANELTKVAIDLWHQSQGPEEYQARFYRFRDADHAGDALADAILDLEEVSTYLEHLDREGLETWIQNRSTRPFADSLNPSLAKSAAVKLVLNLALTRMKSSPSRILKRGYSTDA